MNNSLGMFLVTVFSAFGLTLPFGHREPKSTPPPPPPPPRIIVDSSYTAGGVLLVDLETGDIISENNRDKIFGIASLSKIMTGYVALSYLDPNDPIVMSREALATEGLTGNFRELELFAFKDLMRAMMMSSSNDAAMAIAESVGERLGGRTYDERIELFVGKMNQRARELEMTQTTFRTPTGLDLENQVISNYSSPQDLAKLLIATKSSPLLWESSREADRTIYSYENEAHYITNLNELVGKIPYFVGSKTGTTRASGESLVIVFENPLGSRKGLILLATSPKRRFPEALALLAQITRILP